MAFHNENRLPITKNGDRGWYKWIDGRSRYVCSAKLNQDEALRFWFQNEKTIRAKFRPKVVVPHAAMSLSMLVNRYLTERRGEAVSGKITPEHFTKIRSVCKAMLKSIGPDLIVDDLRPDNFSPFVDTLHRYSARQQRVRARIAMTMFRHAEENDWIVRAPKFGRRMREASNAAIEDVEKDVYTADECRQILAAVQAKAKHYRDNKRPDLAKGYDQLYVLVLMALNGGFGMKELAALKVRNLRVRTGMIESVRTKKQTKHRVPLWPEVLDLLRPMIADKQPNDSMFLTRKGHVLTRSRLKGMKAVSSDGPGQTFVDLIAPLGLKREGHGFYLLKHTHRSVSGGAGDESAADVLVGHRLPGMRAIYQNVDEARLRHVAEHVRRWLFNLPQPKAPTRSRRRQPGPSAA